MSSFYLLETDIEPGGCRGGSRSVANNLDEIKEELADYNDFYVLIWYGLDIELSTIIDGVKVSTIDLLPYITVMVDGFVPEVEDEETGEMKEIHDFEHLVLSFNDKAELIGYDLDREQERGIYGDSGLGPKLFEQELDTKMSIDWDKMPIPPLKGNVVLKDGTATYFVKGQKCSYDYGSDYL